MKHTTHIAIVAALILSLLPLAAVRAQDEPCGIYTCVAKIEWGGPISPWSVSPDPDSNNGQIEELDEYQFFFNPWFGSSAEGVLQVIPGESGVGVQLTRSMLPGTYRIITRMGSHQVLFQSQNITVNVFDSTRAKTEVGVFVVGATFNEFVTNSFVVNTPGNITITMTGDKRKDFFLDYVWIVRVAPGPGTPTPTPLAATATPVATGTPFCAQPTATPTPGVPQFGATPTPTPNPASDWYTFTDFPGAGLPSGWAASGPGTITIAYGAAHIPVSSGSDLNLLVWDRDGVDFSLPFYVSGLVSAQYVAAGQSMFLEVWVLDPVYGWSEATQFQISSGKNYPFYATLNSANGGSGRITAVGFTGRYSPESSAYGIDLHQAAVFGHTRYLPVCGSGNAPINPVRPTAPPQGSETNIRYPSDKLCPPAVVNRPNNFWGYLLAELTIWIDVLFAPSPVYTAQYAVGLVRDLLPLVSVVFVLGAALLDWRVAFATVGIRLVTMSFLALRAAWLFIIRTIKG